MNYHVKITAAGWDGFSGDLCGQQFADSVSSEALPQSVIDRIAAIVPCVIVNEKGKEEPTGQAHRMVGGVAIPAEVNSVARSKIYSEFDHAAADRFGIGEIAQSHPGQRHCNFCGCFRVELVEPGLERASAARLDVFEYLHFIR